jgi:hypothetical protein
MQPSNSLCRIEPPMAITFSKVLFMCSKSSINRRCYQTNNRRWF